jgi:hypothetical protein
MPNMKQFLLLASIGWVGLSSCTHYFAPAMYLQGETYMSKPFLPTDSTSNQKYKQSIYASAQIAGAITPSGFVSNPMKSYVGTLQIHQAHAFKMANLAYGVYGGLGQVFVPAPTPTGTIFPYLPQEAGKKGFGALGFRAEGNFTLPTSHKDFVWRVLGFHFNYSREFGKYWQFRESLVPFESVFVSRSQNMYSWGVNTEICLRRTNYVKEKRINWGVFLKLAYIQSHFPMFENGRDRFGNLLDFSIRRDFSFAFIMRHPYFDIAYQNFFNGFPLFGSMADALSLQINLSAITQKKKAK